MIAVVVMGFLVVLIHVFIQFARQEHIQEYYEEIIIDVEGRLDWAQSRSFFPLGMQAQLQVSRGLLGKAKRLWGENNWSQAYRVALQSQKAMDRAQSIYSAAIKEYRQVR
jgi:hypothetical protein